MHKVYVLTGLPGSGKSTHRRKMFASENNALILNPDSHYLPDDGSQRWTARACADAWAKEWYRFGRWLREPHTDSAVWDATLIDPKSRAPIIHIAKAFEMRVISVYMNTPMQICHERNSARPPLRCVPATTMLTMAANLRKPTTEEGFDELVIIDHKKEE